MREGNQTAQGTHPRVPHICRRGIHQLFKRFQLCDHAHKSAVHSRSGTDMNMIMNILMDTNSNAKESPKAVLKVK